MSSITDASVNSVFDLLFHDPGLGDQMVIEVSQLRDICLLLIVANDPQFGLFPCFLDFSHLDFECFLRFLELMRHIFPNRLTVLLNVLLHIAYNLCETY